MDLLLADISFDAQLVRNQEQRDLALKEKKEKLAASRVERNSKIRAEIEKKGVEETPVQSIQRQIDEIAENIDGDEMIGKKRPVKTWTKRPDNWVDIVEEANLFGSRQAIRSFEEQFEGLSQKASFKQINRWQKDVKT